MRCPSCGVGDLVHHGAGWLACGSCGELLSPENRRDFALFLPNRPEDLLRWWKLIDRVEEAQAERDAALDRLLAALAEERRASSPRPVLP